MGTSMASGGENVTSSKSMTPDERATRFRFVIIGMLFLMAVVNYVDRAALSYTSDQLIKPYGFSKSEWGSVPGCFGYGYMFGAVLGGLTLGLVEQYSQHYADEMLFQGAGAYRDAIAFVVLILVLLVRPRGFFGRIEGEKV